MEKITKKGFNLKKVLNILFYVFLVLVVFYSVLALFSNQDSNSMTVLGVSSMTVQSDSMSGTFEQGDLIFIDTTFDIEELEVGDVITYSMFVTSTEGLLIKVYNTHRITEINIIDGVYWFTTRGDNPEITANDPSPVFMNDILGVWNGGKVANLGTGIDSLVTFLKSPTGFFLFIVLPIFAFLVYQAVRFVGLVSDYKTQKTLGDRVSIEEEAIKIARAQIEAEMRAQASKEKQKEEVKE